MRARYATLPLMPVSLLMIVFLPAVCARADDRREAPEYGAITVSGSGCPDGSVTVTAATGEGARLDLGALVAVATPEAPRQRKSCTAHIPVTVPAGFQVALGRAVAHGEVDLPAGGSGHAVARLFAAGQSSRAAIRAFDDAGRAELVVDTADAPQTGDAPRWLPCGEAPVLVAQVDLIARLEEEGRAEATRLAVARLELPALTYKRCAGP